MAQKNFSVRGDINKSDFSGHVTLINTITKDTLCYGNVVNGILQPMTGVIDEVTMCSIHGVESMFSRYYVFLEGGDVVLNGTNQEGHLVCIGTPLCKEISEYETKGRQLWLDFTENKIISRNEFESMNNNLRTTLIRRHAGDVYGFYMLQESVVSLPPIIQLELYNEVKERMPDALKNNSSILAVIDDIMGRLTTYVNTSEGKKFVEIKTEYDGKEMRLSEYVGKGKYVLADFWASWCQPCLQSIPHLIELYEKYKRDGFEIVGIATRDKPEKTMEAIGKLSIPYPQIINAQTLPTDLYGIDAIPHTILFSPEGIVVARHIYEDRIDEKLKEIFKH